MNKIIKKLGMFVVAFAAGTYYIFACISSIYAASDSCIESIKKNYISEHTAYNIAQSFIVNAVENEVSENWNEYVEAVLLLKCYDTNGNVSAYVYNVINTYSDMNYGYIVIGGSKAYSPIIEFADQGSFFYSDFLGEDEILIYEGSIDY